MPVEAMLGGEEGSCGENQGRTAGGAAPASLVEVSNVTSPFHMDTVKNWPFTVGVVDTERAESSLETLCCLSTWKEEGSKA